LRGEGGFKSRVDSAGCAHECDEGFTSLLRRPPSEVLGMGYMNVRVGLFSGATVVREEHSTAPESAANSIHLGLLAGIVRVTCFVAGIVKGPCFP
jgi:hypothetical protein